MNDLVDFKKLKFLWKLIRLQKFPINYFSKIQNLLFIKKLDKMLYFFRLTLYKTKMLYGTFLDSPCIKIPR